MLGATVIGILALLTGTLGTIIVGKHAGLAVFLISLVGLGLIGFIERRAAARRSAGPDSHLP
jgi:hypothetical protein